MNTLTEASSPSKRIFELLEDHLALAELEFRYECEVGRRRLLIMSIAAVCLISAFVFLQIVITHALLLTGFPLYGVCLILSAFYSLTGIAVYYVYGKRDLRFGKPFEGTQMEMRRTYQWILKHFS